MMPTVLVLIDDKSRLHILQDAGAQVAFADLRIDPYLVLLPQVDQPLEIAAAIQGLKIVTSAPLHDDEAHAAGETMRRLFGAQIVVAEGPKNV